LAGHREFVNGRIKNRLLTGRSQAYKQSVGALMFMGKAFCWSSLGQFFTINRNKSLRQTAQLISLWCFSFFSTGTMCAQAPSVLWTTNVGAQVFAVDELTNVYAGSNGVVIELNGSGAPIQTNVLSRKYAVGIESPFVD
jgi:hypothetical protein